MSFFLLKCGEAYNKIDNLDKEEVQLIVEPYKFHVYQVAYFKEAEATHLYSNGVEIEFLVKNVTNHDISISTSEIRESFIAYSTTNQNYLFRFKPQNNEREIVFKKNNSSYIKFRVKGLSYTSLYDFEQNNKITHDDNYQVGVISTSNIFFNNQILFNKIPIDSVKVLYYFNNLRVTNTYPGFFFEKQGPNDSIPSYPEWY